MKFYVVIVEEEAEEIKKGSSLKKRSTVFKTAKNLIWLPYIIHIGGR